ncbi:MAG: tetratricopeptide repeat protein [Bacteroidia bacterium]|nr:tetratricopeptide repeat protein [Bacteroidia bacterium]
MNKLFLFVSLISGVFLFSCRTSSISIQVLEPADINVPLSIKNLAAINRSLPAKGEGLNNVLEGVVTGEGLFVDRDASKRTIDGLANALASSPRFKLTVPGNIDIKGTGTAQWPIPLDWGQVEKICKDNNVDALLVLETFDSNASHNVTSKKLNKTVDGKQVSYLEFYAHLGISINAGWRIYEPKQKRIIDQNIYTDGMNWDKTGANEKEAVGHLPSQRNATLDAGFYAGQQYSRRISPTWVNVSRMYYVKGNDKMENAKRKVQTNNWTEAAELWQTSLKDPKQKVGGWAAYNLALAAEMEGKLDIAIEWCNKAYTDYGNKAARSYSNILYKRKSDQERLKQQME